MERWHRDRLQHESLLLNEVHRQIAYEKIVEHSDVRDWKLWVANPRSNHVHVLVTSPSYKGITVRDQLKANCTRGLWQHDPIFHNRPVWTTKGDVELIWTEDELERVIEYADAGQDRMDRPKH